AMQRVDDFLKLQLDRESPDRPKYMSRQDMLRLAEGVLSFVLQFHESQVAQAKRDDGFGQIEADLTKKLRSVHLAERAGFVNGNDWDSAFKMANRLADAYPDDRKQIADALSQVISRAAQAGNYDDKQLAVLQKRLKQLEERFPDAPALVPINDRLKQQAE